MDLVKKGQKLTISFLKNDKLVDILCNIVEVLEDRLILDLPQYFMRYIEYLQEGCELTVRVFSKFGTMDFSSIIISSPMEEHFVIEYDKDFYKLTPNNEIEPLVIIENIEINDDKKLIKSKTINISNNMITFSSSEKLELNKNIEIKLLLNQNYGIINLRAFVKEIDDIYTDEYIAEYTPNDDLDREKLFYYLYSESIK